MAVPTYFHSASSPADNGAQADGATLTITPPASMADGDLVIVVCAVQVAPWTSAPTVNNAGGQTWSALVGGTSANDADVGLFWCQFNGTWSANPTFTFASESGTQPVSAIMHVFRKHTGDSVGTWRVDQAYSGSAMSSASPQTITGITNTKKDNVTLACWMQVGTAVTWGTLSGTGWVAMETAQWRNTSGGDISLTFAHQLQGTAEATNNVSQTPSTAQAGVKFIASWYHDLAPTIALDTADSSSFSTATPTVEFTGTDENADDIRYTIQIDTVNTFDSVTGSIATVDSYSESNSDGDQNFANGAGQSFASGTGGTLDSCKFYLKKVGTPTGMARVNLYAHSGTFGTSSVPTGAPLATAQPLDVSTLSTSYALITFKFDGPERVTLSASTNYFLSLEYQRKDTSNTVAAGRDASSPTHGGNAATFDGASWTASPTLDLCFYVYKNGPTPALTKVSGTDSGFSNTVTGGDSDPFNSGEKASFTVQAGDELSATTYYWRVRAKDPNGGDFYSAWATPRSFTVSLGDVTVNATGSAATSATTTPTITGSASLTLTGESMTSSTHDLTVDVRIDVFPAGSSATGSIGDVSISGSASTSPTGSVATTATTAPSIAGSANIPLSGNQIDSASGTVTTTISVSILPDGNEAVSTPGNLSMTGTANISPLGSAATSTAGDASISGGANISITGEVLTSSAGDVIVTTAGDVTVSITGEQLATSPGDLSITGSSSLILSGESMASSVGDVVVSAGGDVIVSLDGMQADSASGFPVISGSAQISVSGESISISDGTATATCSLTILVSGNPADALSGNLSMTGTASIAPTGQPMAIHDGTVIVTAGGDVTILLDGSAIASDSGLVSVVGSASIVLSGSVSTVSMGALAISGSASIFISGSQLLAAAGNIRTGFPLIPTPDRRKVRVNQELDSISISASRSIKISGEERGN